MRSLPWILAGLTIVAVAGGVVLLKPPEPVAEQAGPGRPATLLAHAAPSLRVPLQGAAKRFEADTGIAIEFNFAASEILLNNLKITRKGDLFIPADDSYVKLARDEGLVDRSFDLAEMQGVLLVRENHPLQVITWADVARPEFRIAQPNPDATAVGKLTRDVLTPLGHWDTILKKSPVMSGTITEAANAVKLGSVDGAIVFDAVAKQYPKSKVHPLPGLDAIRARVSAAVCTSDQAVSARWFAEFLQSPEGQTFFAEAGYSPPANRVEVPKNPQEDGDLLLYAGSMLRPAIEETIVEFEKARGVRVTRVYNGCGILVGQMKAGRNPDLYFSCDTRFMAEVADRFGKSANISANQLVIAVPKGNPAGIAALKDLGKPNLRVGVGHEQQCALGAITKDTFIQSGVYAAVRRNVKVESATGDLLVNQLRTGSLDAVVCYISNVTPNLGELDAVPVTGIACAAPKQPVAIALDSRRAKLAKDLIDAIQSKESAERFRKLGFSWEADMAVKGPKD
jgi:molybdate transport system substrate-binding protein